MWCRSSGLSGASLPPKPRRGRPAIDAQCLGVFQENSSANLFFAAFFASSQFERGNRPSGPDRHLRSAIENNMTGYADSHPPEGAASARVVLLIDTENVSAAYRDEMAKCARSHGELVHCIGFARRKDEAWTAGGALTEFVWSEGALNATGRNAADIDLAATAVDLLHAEPLDTVCIASGDRDFTGLARRLHKRGKKVVGIGLLHQTAEAFAKACDAFEVLGPKKGPATEPYSVTEADREHFLDLVERALGGAPVGWRPVSWLGTELRKLEPAIRYGCYGKKGLLALLKTYPEEIETKGAVGREAV